MPKKILCGLLILMLLLPYSLRSQHYNYNFSDLLYYSIGAGANLHMSDNTLSLTHIGFHADAAIGANIFEHLGGRLQFSLLRTPDYQHNPAFYAVGHLDAVWRLFYSLKSGSHNAHQLSLFIGIGAIRRWQNEFGNSDNEFCFVPGIIYCCPISNATQLSIEFKSHIIPPHFDQCNTVSALTSLSVGILHNLNSMARHNGTIDGFYPFQGNWHLSVSAGANMFQYRGITGFNQRIQQTTGAAEISIGKNLSPILGFRLCASGFEAATSESHFKFIDGHLDLMFNITNLIEQQQRRRFNFLFYAGGGIIDRLDTHQPTLQVDFGANTRFWLSERSDLFIDLRYNLIHYTFANISSQKLFSVGMATLSVGYSYNFGKSTCR